MNPVMVGVLHAVAQTVVVRVRVRRVRAPGLLNGICIQDLVEVGETTEIFTNPRHKLTEDHITGRFG